MSNERMMSIAAGLLGCAIIVLLAWRAPIALAASVMGVAAALWLSTRRRRAARLESRGIQIAELRTSALVLLGIWLGLYLVFLLSEQGAGSSAEIPLRFDGETASPGAFFSYGAMGTVGLVALLFTRRPRQPRRRRRGNTKR
jgi:hypothetical protein